MRRAALVLCVLAVMGAAVAAFATVILWPRLLDAPGPHTQAVLFDVPRGAGAEAVAQSLAGAGVVRSPVLFLASMVTLGYQGQIKAGEYETPAGQSLRALLAMLAEGRTYRRQITIPEGWSRAQVIEALEAIPVLEGPVPDSLGEGDILPDTYDYRKGETRAAVVARMVAAQKALMDDLWPRRAPNLPFATPREALILASIVEKETGVKGERPKIAAVFVNRLRKGMMLQSDPTVIYAHTQGRTHIERVLYAHLELESPYNTYRVVGLPPGPIANPGRSAIEAVLNPDAHAYLYFVADGSGGHVFAETYEAHLANVARWRQVQRQGSE